MYIDRSPTGVTHGTSPAGNPHSDHGNALQGSPRRILSREFSDGTWEGTLEKRKEMEEAAGKTREEEARKRKEYRRNDDLAFQAKLREAKGWTAVEMHAFVAATWQSHVRHQTAPAALGI
ncbi:unnamed protein product [Sympodiomycopsis kandeliae]